ncbi:MAG TPA: protein kinase, partial [Thermoanaerobaculia bacterium]|nr:protein kinase [Thermoanaerobaculia bacterium]
TAMSAPAPFLSRHLGDYLLVAQLSDDPLGTVFRALYAADERRFVRLRVLQSEHLPAAAVLEAARTDRLRHALVHGAIVARPELDVVDGIPFMTWDETAGWTLDVMLARVRAFGIRIPVEYALLIVERIAAALEHAHQTTADGRPVAHGLLWPGFVSISHDAAVRIGGFGLADAILPGLAMPRLTAEIAPYLAPESRRSAQPSPSGDVYSLGAILMELVTGRRPSADTPSTEMRAGDPRSEELSQFLRRCLAGPDERFASGVEAHRALQQMVTGNPFSLFTANLSLFLYKLLNPESQTVAPSSDWESTSPVVVETKTRRPDEAATATATGSRTGPPRRRRGDLDPTEDRPAAASPRLAPPAPEPAPHGDPFPAAEPAPVEVLEEASRLIEESPDAPAEPALALEEPAPAPPVRPAPVPLPPWTRSALLLTAAAGLVFGVFLVAGRAPSPPRPEESASAKPRDAAPATAPAPFPTTVPESAPTPSAAPSASAAIPPARAARPAHPVRTELRAPTEDLRYRAALARVEADRLRASEKTPEIFEEGVRREQDGLRLLKERDYDAARNAFSRAAQLFDEAREKTWEERVRDTSLTAAGN